MTDKLKRLSELGEPIKTRILDVMPEKNWTESKWGKGVVVESPFFYSGSGKSGRRYPIEFYSNLKRSIPTPIFRSVRDRGSRARILEDMKNGVSLIMLSNDDNRGDDFITEYDLLIDETKFMFIQQLVREKRQRQERIEREKRQRQERIEREKRQRQERKEREKVSFLEKLSSPYIQVMANDSQKTMKKAYDNKFLYGIDNVSVAVIVDDISPQVDEFISKIKRHFRTPFLIDVKDVYVIKEERIGQRLLPERISMTFTIYMKRPDTLRTLKTKLGVQEYSEQEARYEGIEGDFIYLKSRTDSIRAPNLSKLLTEIQDFEKWKQRQDRELRKAHNQFVNTQLLQHVMGMPRNRNLQQFTVSVKQQPPQTKSTMRSRNMDLQRLLEQVDQVLLKSSV